MRQCVPLHSALPLFSCTGEDESDPDDDGGEHKKLVAALNKASSKEKVTKCDKWLSFALALQRFNSLPVR